MSESCPTPHIARRIRFVCGDWRRSGVKFVHGKSHEIHVDPALRPSRGSDGPKSKPHRRWEDILYIRAEAVYHECARVWAGAESEAPGAQIPQCTRTRQSSLSRSNRFWATRCRRRRLRGCVWSVVTRWVAGRMEHGELWFSVGYFHTWAYAVWSSFAWDHFGAGNMQSIENFAFEIDVLQSSYMFIFCAFCVFNYIVRYLQQTRIAYSFHSQF